MKSALVIFLSSIHVVSASENTAGCLLRDGNVAEKVGRYRSQLVEFFFNIASHNTHTHTQNTAISFSNSMLQNESRGMLCFCT